MFFADMTVIQGQDFVVTSPVSMSFGPIAIVGLAIIFVGIGAWMSLRRQDAGNGETMERSERIAPLYGYSVCLIAVIVTLMSVNTIVEKIFTLQNPLVAANTSYPWDNSGVLTSFEAYKATYGRSMAPPGASRPDTATAKPTDAELHTRYDALRADAIERTTANAHRELTQSVILLILAVALFWWHWRWVRTR